MNQSAPPFNLILLNKPFNVLCQFTDDENRVTLADYVTDSGFYPAGRLDYDSEGLVLLTNNGKLQHQIANPQQKMKKTYWVQLEGRITDEALKKLQQGVELKDGVTRPAKAKQIEPNRLWERNPPVRERKNIVTSWIELQITEGKNRQVRRMTAAVGYPTLRLIRIAIGPWQLKQLQPGESEKQNINMPKASTDSLRGKPNKGKKR